MPGLATRLKFAAAKLMGNGARDVPVPYQLPCDCGHRVAGIRRAVAIQAECSECGKTIYVLPVNVYPSTRRVRSEVLDGSAASRLGTAIQDVVSGSDSTPAANSESSRSKTSTVEPRRKGQRPSSDAGDVKATARDMRGNSGQTPQVATAPIPQGVVRLPRVKITTRVRRAITPFRLLMLAGILVLAGTGWWVVHQRSVDVARRTWRTEMDIANTAIKELSSVGLQQSLERAVAAARVLGRDDAESRRAEALLRQTIAVENLCRLDLVDRLSKSEPRAGVPASSPMAVETIDEVEGEWFIFDCPLTPQVAGTQSTTPQLVSAELLLIVEEAPISIVASSSLLERFAAMHRNLPVIFAAQISRCERSGDASNGWIITLDGDSCCLITTEHHARQIGYDPDAVPELAAILERQAAFIEAASDDHVGANVARLPVRRTSSPSISAGDNCSHVVVAESTQSVGEPPADIITAENHTSEEAGS